MVTKTSIKRPVTTVMIILIVFLAGIVAYNNLELAYMPSTDMPMAVVSTTYTGAGPEEMEELVTKPIEESMATLTGVENITSTSSTGSSMVMIEFVEGTDLDSAANDMREKLDRVKRQLPDDAGDPSIMKMDMNADSINIGITSNKYDLESLYTLLEQNITSRFERIEGISSVSMMGGVEKEIQIIVDPVKLSGYGINISKIRQTLSNENQNIPSGELKQGENELTLRAVGEFKSLNEISNLPITTSSGNMIYIKDVADVKEVEKERENLSLINGNEGIMYSLSKQSDANIVTVTKNIRAEIDKILMDYSDIEIQMLTTTADYIETSVNNVVSTAFQSAFIAVFVLLIFLRDPKTSLIIGVSIPTSIVATFGMMYLKGMTLNTISMGGLVIGIGMLVDNSVVVLENIFTYSKKGFSPKEAAEFGAKEVSMAITASTLTTIAVFGPLIFVSGMIGTMLQDLAYTICFSLIASLIVSLTFVPMMCSKLLSNELKKASKENKKKTIFKFIGEIWLYCLDSIDGFYKIVLQLAIKHRIITIVIVIMCFILSLTIIPFMGMDLMSNTDEGTVSINISMPDGVEFEYSREILTSVLDKIIDIEEIETSIARTGGGRGGSGGTSASINLNLYDVEERKRSTEQIISEIKQRLKNIAGAKITVSASRNAMGSMGGGSDLSLKINGEETDTLKQISDDLIVLFSEIPGADELESSLDDALLEGNIVLNRKKASKYGISTSDLASAISTANSGVVATQYRIDGTEIDVKIKYSDDKIKYVNDLNNITITGSNGVVIPITDVADVVMGKSAMSISRENQQRYITITGKFNGMNTSSVQQEVIKKLNSYVFPDNYSYEFGGNMRTMQESFSNLAIVFIVAILLVYMIMASQFESLIYPFIVMFSMPLAITGGILGLFITGQSITVNAFMGFIMLIGMVVNNAIVLVDYTNQLIENKQMECNDALIQAGPARLRPILMTTLTTIIGLMPMAFGTASGMEIQQPLGIAVIFGLTVSTVITLILIPVLYSVVNSIKIFIIKIKNKIIKRDNLLKGESL